MAKRVHSDGKSFENLVKTIQEAYKDLPGTEILSDVKLTDKTGSKGQIDVLVKIKANGFKLTVAIECKDYNKPVGKDKIDAFYSKCDMIEEIDKVVFVSKSGYQSGAISAAKYRGIELYNIEDVTADLLSKWIEELGNFFQISIESLININYTVFFTNGKKWPGVNIPPDTVTISESGLHKFKEYVKQCIDNLAQVYVLSAITNIILNNFEFYITNKLNTFEEKLQFETDFTNNFRLGYHHNNQKFHTHYVSSILFSMDVIFKLHHPNQIIGKKYSGIVRATNQANILQVKMDNYDFQVIKIEESAEPQYFRTDTTGSTEKLQVLHERFIKKQQE